MIRREEIIHYLFAPLGNRRYNIELANERNRQKGTQTAIDN